MTKLLRILLCHLIFMDGFFVAMVLLSISFDSVGMAVAGALMAAILYVPAILAFTAINLFILVPGLLLVSSFLLELLVVLLPPLLFFAWTAFSTEQPLSNLMAADGLSPSRVLLTWVLLNGFILYRMRRLGKGIGNGEEGMEHREGKLKENAPS